MKPGLPIARFSAGVSDRDHEAIAHRFHAADQTEWKADQYGLSKIAFAASV